MAAARSLPVDQSLPQSIERSKDSNGPSPSFGPKDVSSFSLMSVDEFDARYPPEPACAVPVIRPLSARIPNGELISKFNQMCQVLSLVPNFTYTEISKGNFVARVIFGGYNIETGSSFPSKKSAKNELCRRGITILESLDRPRSRSRSRPEKSVSSRTELKAGLSDEEWVPILNEYVQQKSLPYPVYQEYEGDTRSQQARGLALNSRQYACTVTLPSEQDHVFGSDSELFYQKADAKRNAAMDAVRWLRASNKLQALPPPRIQGHKPGAVSQDAVDPTVQIRGTDAGTCTAAQRVHNLALELGFQVPQYHIHPCVSPAGSASAGFVETEAVFSPQDVAREPRLGGRLGRTGKVFGKKHAKEECCKELLRILEEIASHRLE